MENVDLKPKLIMFHNAISARNFDDAYKIDFLIMERMVKSSDSEALWNEWQALTYSIRYSLLPATFEPHADCDLVSKTPTFLIYNFSGLAHEVNIRSLMKGWQERCRVIYAFGAPDKRAQLFYSGINVEIIFLNADPNNPTSSLGARLGKLYEIVGPVFITTVTSYVLCFWVSIIAPRHKHAFFAMRFIPYQVPSIGKWLVGGAGESIIFHGQQWNVVSRPWTRLFDLKRISTPRKTLSVGSISREAKVNNPSYLSTISAIMNAVPEIEFLITGRSLPGEIFKHFESCGCENRYKFLGWVDPENAMGLIDIYLEPFPFGGGEMLFQAIENRVPFVYFADIKQSNLAITDNYLTSIFGEEVLRPHRATSCESYIAKSIEIVRRFSFFNSTGYWEGFFSSTERKQKHPDIKLFILN